MDKDVQDKELEQRLEVLFRENDELIQVLKILRGAFQYACEFIVEHPPTDALAYPELLHLCIDSGELHKSDDEKIKNKAWEIYGDYFINKSMERSKENEQQKD